MEEIIGEETPYLPEQVIMEEILTILPVKLLLKFRCVSKSWCSLIDSKRFIKAHLKRSIKSSRFANNCIFVDYEGEKFDKLFAHPISRIDADLGIENFDLILPVGCCNGLVCILVDGERFILWNPTTKTFKNLPDLYNLIQLKDRIIIAYGFGFDELNDDYKVFCKVKKGSPPNCLVMIYSLRSNSWKHIEETYHVSPLNDDGEGMGIHVSGKLHWTSYKDDILSFDLNSHVSGVIELPSYTKGTDLNKLGAVGGCLGALFFHPHGDSKLVWVMKEYGVKESWDKVLTLPYYGVEESWDKLVTLPYNLYRDIPAPNGEVFLIRNSNVIIYNPKCEALTYPEGIGLDGGVAEVSSMGIYIESLVSVSPDSQ